MSPLNDPAAVARGYASEDGVAARRSLYEGLEGEDMKELLAQAVLALAPRSVLEAGPGRGELGQRLVEAGIPDYRGVDVSPRMVQLVHARGLDRGLAETARVLEPGGRCWR